MRIPGWRSEVCVYLHLLLLLAGREELLFVSGCNSHKEAVSRLFLAPPFLSPPNSESRRKNNYHNTSDRVIIIMG